MSESTAVTVGLDVHARSIRLAVVCAEELLEERRLAFDERQVERLLRRWPGGRCCSEAGPTGFGLYRHLLARGVDCQGVAPGLVPQRRGGGGESRSRGAGEGGGVRAGGGLGASPCLSPRGAAAAGHVAR